MFSTARRTPLFAAHAEAHALAHEAWREAVSDVAARWQVFLEARGESRTWAFVSYVAALDAEEAAAADLARAGAAELAHLPWAAAA